MLALNRWTPCEDSFFYPCKVSWASEWDSFCSWPTSHKSKVALWNCYILPKPLLNLPFTQLHSVTKWFYASIQSMGNLRIRPSSRKGITIADASLFSSIHYNFHSNFFLLYFAIKSILCFSASMICSLIPTGSHFFCWKRLHSYPCAFDGTQLHLR